ncbi:patatin-like phospholipase domain-containing protein 2 [Penaeus indicus]|uniref:patatin-like phospholipase domain-containing protein 2 n=1 Tax=Penaeus indicus TaxID=29960 RepID=UPI00300C2A4F
MAALAIKFSSVLARNSAKSKLLSRFLVPKVERCLRSFATSLPIYKKEMLEITYETTDGKKFTVQGKEGDNLLDIVINNDVDLDGFGACEGTLACSTCHLIFKKEDFDRIEEPSTDEELDMLDLAYGLTDTEVCVALSGSGFLALYEVGALECLQKQWPRLLQTAKVSGASAGSLLAACVVCDVPLSFVKANFLETAKEAQRWKLGPFSPKFKVSDYLNQGFEALPPDAHLRANNRLFVSLTRIKDGQNVIISNWTSREDLIQCLLCSCFIPVFSGYRFPSFRGERYMDGGFTNNLPIPGQPCISIGPFEGKIDICPRSKVQNSPYLTIANETVAINPTNILRFVQSLKPPAVEILEEVYQEGYWDAYSFLKAKTSQKTGPLSA